MQNPKVTIVIPTYNRPIGILMRAINSVYAQTYKDYELIVVDDCSDSPVMFPEISTINIRHILNKENKGKSWSVNHVIKDHAKGQYILIIDDDNEILPTFLEETVGCLEEASSLAMTRENGSYDACFTGRIIRHTGFDDYAPASWVWGYGFHSIDWGWLIKKEVFEKIQYDEDIFGDEDADFGIQFFKNFKAVPLDKPLCIAYAEGGSGVCFANEKRIASLMRFYNKNWKAYEKAGPKDLSFINRFIGRNLYQAGMKKEATPYFWRAFTSYKNRRTLTHFLVSLVSYRAYYNLMRLEERYYSYKRRKSYGIK